MKLITILCLVSIVLALDNGLGLVPPMGWNSWNHFGCNINEKVVRQTADAFISTGLAAAGYQYVNVDDCWEGGRDSQGKPLSDPKTFPSGMKALADYIHSKGLKFGLYSDAGYKTCAGRIGSLGYETVDAQAYASWDVDYLKYDNCNTDGSSPKVRYPVMRDALNKTGRPIFYSMCEWGVENPATWAAPVGNSWRTTGDISDKWSSIVHILDQQVNITKYAGPGGWNDPDMLEVGNGGCSYDEYMSHFSLWALLKAPLLIGCDVASMKKETVEILTNREVIAVNQDPLGISGSRISKNGDLEVWAGPISGRNVAVILFNRGSTASTISVKFSDVQLGSKSALVRDLWKHESLGIYSSSFSALVKPHAVVMVKLIPN